MLERSLHITGSKTPKSGCADPNIGVRLGMTELYDSAKSHIYIYIYRYIFIYRASLLHHIIISIADVELKDAYS